MSILEKLYEGKLYPAEQIKPNDPDYRKVTDEYCDLMDAAALRDAGRGICKDLEGHGPSGAVTFV